MWCDYNLTSSGLENSNIYASAFVPLWANLYWDGLTTGIYNESYISEKVQNAITQSQLFVYPGGLPTSLLNSGQQWDFPNGWAPLQIFSIYGLRNLGEFGINLSTTLASNWLQNNYNGWIASQYMYEKYNVTTTSGLPGNGGEYDVQSGFGWTNGVVLELLLGFCVNSIYFIFPLFFFFSWIFPHPSDTCLTPDGFIDVNFTAQSTPNNPPGEQENTKNNIISEIKFV